MKIFATSDIHGNKALIYLIREIVKKEDIDTLIIAGDIAPKGFYQFCGMWLWLGSGQANYSRLFG